MLHAVVRVRLRGCERQLTRLCKHNDLVAGPLGAVAAGLAFCSASSSRAHPVHCSTHTKAHASRSTHRMTSKLAQKAFAAEVNRQHVRDFYHEVCRCLPFIQRLHQLEEVATLKDLRAAVKHKFNEFKSAKDPRVVDTLIFKGREELECYLMMHKQRHHAITEYIEPFKSRKASAGDKPSTNSAFLDAFLTTSYPQTAQKQ